MSYEILKIFLSVQNELRLYHWNTKIYSRHIASGNLYEKLNDQIDRFIETLQGELGEKIKYKNITLQFDLNTDDSIVDVLENFKEILKSLQDISIDLKNQRDDMYGEVNRTLYLFTLK